MKYMNKFLGEEPKKNILCNRYFIWLVFLASIQPDLLIQKSIVITLFNLVTIGACGLICLDTDSVSSTGSDFQHPDPQG